MNRWTNLGLAAIAAGSLAAAQSLRVPVEAYGTSCGPTIRAGNSGPRSVALRVDGATPHAQLVLMIGTRRNDQALPGSRRRLLTVPELSVPLVANSRGAAVMSLALPGIPRGMLRAQAVEIGADGGLEASGGLTLRTGSGTQQRGRVLATLRVGSAKFRFVETAPGEVLVAGSGPGRPPALPNDRFDSVELYERLAGTSAPTVLRRAAAAARSNAQWGPLAMRADRPSTSIGKSGGGPGPTACFSWSWFHSNFCQSGSGWLKCYLNNYGNPWAGSWCTWLLAATACNSGAYWFDYMRHEGGSWKIKDTIYVTACNWYWYGVSGGWASRRMRVDYGGGDGKHFSCKGN